MKKLLLFLMVLCVFPFFSFAQQTITGTVTDQDNVPVPGANVLIKGTYQGTITNQDGKYSISLNSDDAILVFSMIGMLSKELPVNGQTEINVAMEQNPVGLEQVVVVGYGKVKKSDLSGSVSSVRGDDMLKVTNANPLQALAGKVAGLQVSAVSGQPGQGPELRIRGVGTLNNSRPIYVVDGMILNDISFLSSRDIQSVEVLKDASATAIYGNRGANGVIIITTKMGKESRGKAIISYSASHSIQKVAKKIELMSGEEFANAVNFMYPGTYNNIRKVSNTDWQDLIFRTAPIQQQDLSVSGATEFCQYYYGISLFDQEGIIQNSGYKRLSIKLNNVFNISDHVKVGNNITLSPYRENDSPGNIIFQAYRAQPTVEPYLESEGYYSVEGVEGVSSLPNGGFNEVPAVGNPLAELAFKSDETKGVRGVANLFAEADFLEMFTFKTSFGIDAAYSKQEQFTSAFMINNAQYNYYNDLTKDNKDNLTWLWENTVSFNKAVKKHSFSALAGYTMQKATSSEMKLVGENLLRDGEDFWYIYSQNIYDETLDINHLSDIANSDYIDENLYYSMVSYLGRVNYVYDNRYILTATIRRDGSSKFNEDNRWGNFPSFAAAWNVSNEHFMKDRRSAISNLKVRASWGIVGNDKINYSNRYSATQNTLTIFGLDNISSAGTTYSKSGNDDLKWETTRQADIGLEIGLVKNKLTTEFDYYNKHTEGILVDLLVPGYLGNGVGTKITYNAAEVLNCGFEFNLNWRDKVGELTYNVGLLGSFLHNEVLEIGGSIGIDSTLVGGDVTTVGNVTQTRVGIPVGSFYGYKTDGIFQNEDELNSYPHMPQAGVGDIRYVDVNKDGVLNGDDRTDIGSPIPTFIFGFNISAELKGFDIAADVYGQVGNKIYNAKEEIRPDLYNFEKHVTNYWTGEGTTDSEPTLHSSGNYNYLPSDRFVQDGSFLRLRNISAGYTIPVKRYISKLRVYIKGDQLITLTKYTGYTPEISGYNPNGGTAKDQRGQDVLSNGIDYGTYPAAKIVSLGLDLIF